VHPPADGLDWLALTAEPLPVGAAYEWAVLPSCGAVVLFSGTARDHADGRTDVVELTYEAYEEHVLPRFAAIAAEIRRSWPTTGRIAVLHRTGALALGESSVVIVVSAPHRAEAFEAARFGIDTLKATAPIWKQERWADGTDWALGAHVVTDVAQVADAAARRERAARSSAESRG
jgi:molybdopterin synthase catalytic subunit